MTGTDAGNGANAPDSSNSEDSAAAEGGQDAANDTGLGGESVSDASLDGDVANPCVTAAIDASGDPFAGVWTGVQQNETWTYVLNEGMAAVTAQNDSCSGSYTVTSSSTATGTLMCMPLTSAGSPAHTDTGTYTLSDGGTAMTYAYSYGSPPVGAPTGSNSQTVTRVCP